MYTLLVKLTLLRTSHPVKKTNSINISEKDHHDTNNSSDHGHGIFVTPYARSLEGKNISARHSTKGRYDQEGAEFHPTQAKDIAQIIFRETRKEKKQETCRYSCAGCDKVKLLDDFFFNQSLDERPP